MNYITALREANTERACALAKVEREINAFLAFLHSDKFKGHESNGDRKDWIATSDVIHRLIEIRSQASAPLSWQNTVKQRP